MGTCKQRWRSHKDSRISDLKKLIAAYHEGEDSALYKKVYEELGDLSDYGLCLDFVPVGTFSDQTRSYFRYQLSYGGPSDEFRFYGELLGEYKAHLEYIEYVFLDWGDGHARKLRKGDHDVLAPLFYDWAECGTLHHLMKEALE